MRYEASPGTYIEVSDAVLRLLLTPSRITAITGSQKVRAPQR